MKERDVIEVMFRKDRSGKVIAFFRDVFYNSPYRISGFDGVQDFDYPLSFYRKCTPVSDPMEYREQRGKLVRRYGCMIRPRKRR